MTPIEQILAAITIHEPSDCWIYPVLLNTGYGRIYADGQTQLTHRITYEAMVGPIPNGHQIDHLCRTKACCNPSHLEPVTCLENTRRAMPFRRQRSEWKPRQPKPEPESAPPLPKIITLVEASRSTGLPTASLRGMCRSRQLPGAYKTSERGHWRIPETAITAYIAQRQENQP